MQAGRLSVLVAAFVSGCSGSSTSGFGLDDAGKSSSSLLHTGDGGAHHVEASTLSQPDSAQQMMASSGPAVVYGQSDTTLYAVDPDTKAVTAIADFSGCDSAVIDIALDKSSKMYGTTFGGVYTIDTTTAVCTLLATGTYPNSLSFVPVGTLDPTEEALVGYNGSTYVHIDTTTGNVTTVGDLGKGYSSSGDIVSVIGGGTYLTVTGGDACSQYDCLVEVDPVTGALKTNYGPIGYSEVYGLAFWAGTVYGFDSAGDLFQVTFTGSKANVTAIPIPSAPAGLSFYGAGSTTSAPPVATAK